MHLKNKTTFTLEEIINLAIFNLDEVKNITSNNYHFDFTLDGKLNKDLNEQSFDVKIPLNKIEDKTVQCKFNIKTNKTASLKCDFNLEEYKNTYQNFSLKVTEVSDTSNTPIYLSRINEVNLIHEENGKEEEEEDDDDGNKKVIIIVVVVVVSVAVVSGGSGLGFFLYRRKKIKI